MNALPDTYLFHQTLASDYDAFSIDPLDEHEQALEEASDDQITSWLLDLGITAEEIELSHMEGISLRDLAEGEIRKGYTFGPSH